MGCSDNTSFTFNLHTYYVTAPLKKLLFFFKTTRTVDIDTIAKIGIVQTPAGNFCSRIAIGPDILSRDRFHCSRNWILLQDSVPNCTKNPGSQKCVLHQLEQLAWRPFSKKHFFFKKSSPSETLTPFWHTQTDFHAVFSNMSRDIELINILVKTRLHKVKPFSKYATLNIREQKFPLPAGKG